MARLRSFHRFAVRSSSGNEGNIIFEIFQCSLTKAITVKLTKIENLFDLSQLL